MSNRPHELGEDFPGAHDRIHALKTQNAHFARLVEEYHAVNAEVHQAETLVRPTDPTEETRLRKKRAMLKDEIARMLAAA